MTLTSEQLKANINALEKQGASQSEIQQYLNKQKTPATSEPVDTRDGLQKVTDVVTSIFPGGKIGEYLGTKYVSSQQRAKGNEDIAANIDAAAPTAGQLAGDAAQIALTFAPLGAGANAVKTGAKALGAGEMLAGGIGKLAAGAGAGYAFDVSQGLKDKEENPLTPGIGTAIGGAIPLAGSIKNQVVRFGESQAPTIINSLIAPGIKDFSYGKNPGRAVAEAGIVARNFDELATKIRQERQATGQLIGSLGTKLSGKPQIQLGDSLSVIDDAIRSAASQNNATLLQRLQAVKRSITHVLEPEVLQDGSIGIKEVGQRKLDNLTFSESRDILGQIGDVTQFTGNPSDDKLVNSALKRVYGNIKEATLDAADKIDPVIAKQFRKETEKYADLISAEVATKHRENIAERANMIGLKGINVGIGGALLTSVATGGALTPAVAAGLAGSVLTKLAGTPAFKTRLAAILSKKSPEEVRGLFKVIPQLQAFFPKGGSMTPGDRLLRGK